MQTEIRIFHSNILVSEEWLVSYKYLFSSQHCKFRNYAVQLLVQYGAAVLGILAHLLLIISVKMYQKVLFLNKLFFSYLNFFCDMVLFQILILPVSNIFDSKSVTEYQ